MKRAAIGIATLAGVALATPAVAGQGNLYNEIMQAYQEINQAFIDGDVEGLKRLTTDDHVAVTHAGSADKSVVDRLGDNKLVGFNREIVSDVVVEEIAPGVVIQRFDAEMRGSYNGVPVPEHVAITIIWQQQDGRWVERLYQHTPIG